MATRAEFELIMGPLDLKRISRSGETRDAIVLCTQVLERSAKQHAPVRTGNLRRSIYSEVTFERGTWVGRTGTNVKYGFFQEVGTVNHPAHPYLRPALAELQARIRTGRMR